MISQPENMLERIECKPKTPRPKEQFENIKGCDKGGHKERSIANQPNHQNHWRKVGR